MEKGRILVVDDDESFLILISHLLKGMDYEAVTISDSTVAYEKIIEFSPDLIISDIRMPSLDGNALLKIIKSSKLTSHIPVVETMEPEEVVKLLNIRSCGQKLTFYIQRAYTRHGGNFVLFNHISTVFPWIRSDFYNVAKRSDDSNRRNQ